MQEHGPREHGPRREPAATPERKRETGTIVKAIVALILLILFIWFIAANSRQVTVDLLFTTAQVALIWVFLACALIGALIAYLLARPSRRETRKYIRELERRLEHG